MDELDGVEIIAFPDAEAFEDWLAEHHTRGEGVWVKVAKKKSGLPTVTSEELVDIGLCYGWISGQRRSSTSGTTCRSTCRAGPGACGRR
ncbi:YdeI family protein [Nocardiopsis composta]